MSQMLSQLLGKLQTSVDERQLSRRLISFRRSWRPSIHCLTPRLHHFGRSGTRDGMSHVTDSRCSPTRVSQKAGASRQRCGPVLLRRDWQPRCCCFSPLLPPPLQAGLLQLTVHPSTPARPGRSTSTSEPTESFPAVSRRITSNQASTASHGFPVGSRRYFSFFYTRSLSPKLSATIEEAFAEA